MSDKGTIVAHIYTSDAKISLQGAVMTVSLPAEDGLPRLRAVRFSNADGFTDAVSIDTPPFEESQAYKENNIPYATADLSVQFPDYERVIVRNVQIFADRQTVQEFQLVPTPSLPDSYTNTQIYTIPAQTL